MAYPSDVGNRPDNRLAMAVDRLPSRRDLMPEAAVEVTASPTESDATAHHIGDSHDVGQRDEMVASHCDQLD